jgi:hypothetical protein
VNIGCGFDGHRNFVAGPLSPFQMKLGGSDSFNLTFFELHGQTFPSPPNMHVAGQLDQTAKIQTETLPAPGSVRLDAGLLGDLQGGVAPADVGCETQVGGEALVTPPPQHRRSSLQTFSKCKIASGSTHGVLLGLG